MSEKRVWAWEEFNKLPVNQRTGCFRFTNGSKRWYKEGKLHREDGPAFESVGGTKEWFKEGILHRLDGPAREFANGDISWYIDGKRYYSERDYKARIASMKNVASMNNPKEKIWEYSDFHKSNERTGKFVFVDGKTCYYKNGMFHREDGPAKEHIDGHKEWYKEGKLHRLDGPAIEHSDGSKFWWIDDHHYTEEEYKAKVSESNIVYTEEEFDELPKDKQNGCVKFSNGEKCWYKEGKLHREDGPAVECANGDKFWYKKDQLHREDGPAIEYANGNKCWYKEGKFHREDGPAIEFANGNKEWYKENKLHREDGPAVEYANGDKYWYKDNDLHREGGPAIEWSDGRVEYWLEDVRYTKDKYEAKMSEKVWTAEEFNELPTEKQIGCFNFVDGSKRWYKEGLLHREDGPALESAHGTKFWFKEGKYHREDGPAIEFADGTKEYWLDDKKYSEEEYYGKDRQMSFPVSTPLNIEVKADNTFIKMLSNDFDKATYRVAATQMSRVVKSSILRILESKGIDNSKSSAIAEMLDTEIGSAIIALLLGYGLTYLPKISEDNRVKRLSEEFRVKGMETIGNEVIGSLLEHMLPEVMRVLSNLPKSDEKVRVIEPESDISISDGDVIKFDNVKYCTLN